MLPIGLGQITSPTARLAIGEPEHALLVSNVDAAIAAVRDWNHKPTSAQVLEGNQQLTGRLMRALSALQSYETAKFLTMVATEEKARSRL